jgi:formamidopyrimidine-DNA glycosylase
VTGLQKPEGAHPIDKHTHLVLRLSGNGHLMFRDPRTFGKLVLVPGISWPDHVRLRKLGLEPLLMKPAVVAKTFPTASIRSVKALLLDQEFLAGVGNIYADEALFLAGINPRRSSYPANLPE